MSDVDCEQTIAAMEAIDPNREIPSSYAWNWRETAEEALEGFRERLETLADHLLHFAQVPTEHGITVGSWTGDWHGASNANADAVRFHQLPIDEAIRHRAYLVLCLNVALQVAAAIAAALSAPLTIVGAREAARRLTASLAQVLALLDA